MRSTEMDILRPAHAAPAKRMAKQIRPEKSNQAGRPTAAELERRKARVMEVATELFVSRGYAATSLVDIAKGAGVATRTLYQHFGDKEAIFREVIFARRASAMIPMPDLGPAETLFAALHRTAEMSCHYVFAERSVDLMRLMVAESRRFPDLMKRVANATFIRFRANIAAVFERLADRGQIPDGDHALSAQLFLDLVLGSTLVMFYGDWATTRSTTEEMDLKIDLFIQGRFGPLVAKTSRSKAPVRRRAARDVVAADPVPMKRKYRARGAQPA
jgi:TetR/AcrR family transcriptional regulator, mexJK operon transcriptional repressor